jgi:hypothetical protein
LQRANGWADEVSTEAARARQREQTAKEEADAAKRREMAMVQEAAVEVAKCREVAQASMREAENAKRELEHHRHAEAEARRAEAEARRAEGEARQANTEAKHVFALAQAESEHREREAERREHEALRRAEQAALSATEVSEKAKLESKALSDSMRDQEALASELARVQRLLADVRRDLDGTRAALEDTKMELHAKKCDLALAKADAEARTRALERAQLDAVQLARKTIHFADWQTAHHGAPHGVPPLHMPTPSFAAEAVCSSPSYATSYVEASSPRFSPPLTPTGLTQGPPSPRAASMAGTFRGAADPSSTPRPFGQFGGSALAAYGHLQQHRARTQLDASPDEHVLSLMRKWGYQ